MSLVEVQPSTDMALKESRTAIRRRSASGPGSISASVVRKASMVAMSGASIPAPLAIPATAKVGCSTSTSLRPESVVRMAWAASAAAPSEPVRAATSRGMPDSMGSIGSGIPMSPVEQTRTCSAGTPRPEATREHIRSASARPRSPVAALAFPLLTITPDARWPLAARWPRLTWTGAAAARLVVKVAAVGTAVPPSVASRARSMAPLTLIPDARPEATNPLGVVMLTGTSRPGAGRGPPEGPGPGWRTGRPGPPPP